MANIPQPQPQRTAAEWLSFFQASRASIVTRQAVELLAADAAIAGAQAAVDAENNP